MALVDDLITEVGLAGYDDFSTTQILELMQEVLDELATENPQLEFYRTTASVNLTASSATIPMPADFFTSHRLYDATLGYTLEPLAKDELVIRYSGQLTDVGDPIFYYPENGGYKCYPLPSSNRTLTWDYNRLPAALTIGGTTIDLPIRHKRLLVKGAIVECAILEGDLDMTPGYEAAYQAKLAKVLVDLGTNTQLDRPKIVHDVYWTDDYNSY